MVKLVVVPFSNGLKIVVDFVVGDLRRASRSLAGRVRIRCFREPSLPDGTLNSLSCGSCSRRSPPSAVAAADAGG